MSIDHDLRRAQNPTSDVLQKGNPHKELEIKNFRPVVLELYLKNAQSYSHVKIYSIVRHTIGSVEADTILMETRFP
jgi:hypothetical protein